MVFFLLPLAFLGGTAVGTAYAIKSYNDDEKKAEYHRTEQLVRREIEKTERAKRETMERAEQERQMALDRMRTEQNIVLCHDLDAQRASQAQRFTIAAQEIFANRDIRIAQIQKELDTFAFRQREIVEQKHMGLEHQLVQKLESYHLEEDSIDRLLIEQRAKLEKKRIDIEKARKEEGIKKLLWRALNKILADGQLARQNGRNLLAIFPTELLEHLETEQLEMLIRLYGHGKGTSWDDEQMKEEIHTILVQSDRMMRTILEKYELDLPQNYLTTGKKTLQIDGQTAAKMGNNDLFFVACNGGEMFSKLCIEADALAVDEFLPVLCNYAALTELPQLLVPIIVLQFREPFNKPIPKITALYDILNYDNANTDKHILYVALNTSTVPSIKCVVEITQNVRHGACPKLGNFELKIVAN